MSQEYIVNRVAQPPYQQIEEAQLKVELEQDVDTIATDLQVPSVEPEQKDGTPAPEIVEDLNGEQYVDPGVLLSGTWPTISELLNNLELKSRLAKVGFRVDEFEVFRLQVIAAFKHLGLDTKKFFGE